MSAPKELTQSAGPIFDLKQENLKVSHPKLNYQVSPASLILVDSSKTTLKILRFFLF